MCFSVSLPLTAVRHRGQKTGYFFTVRREGGHKMPNSNHLCTPYIKHTPNWPCCGTHRRYKNTGSKHLRARGATTSALNKEWILLWDDELVMVPRYMKYTIFSQWCITERERTTIIIERQEHTPLRECRVVEMNDIYGTYTESNTHAWVHNKG